MKTSSRPGILAGCLALIVALAGCTTASSLPDVVAANATETVTLKIQGGHETGPVGNGRPVVLIAAALGVPTEVFREAFSGVSPAGAGQEVDEERANANKAVLLGALAPYGVSNDRLDEVSNFYRYVESAGELWSHRDATVVAVVENGVVTSISVTDAGFGYSSVPTVTLPPVSLRLSNWRTVPTSRRTAASSASSSDDHESVTMVGSGNVQGRKRPLMSAASSRMRA